MNTRDLTIKFAAYEQYIESREWAKEGLTLPRLFCVVPDIAQERRMQRVAQPTLPHIPGVELWTTTEVLLNEQGPLASIWLQSMKQPGQTLLVRGLPRKCLFDTMLSEHSLSYLALQFRTPLRPVMSGSARLRFLTTSDGASQD